MNNQQPVNMIGLYAKLEITKERLEAQGKPVPENIIRNMQAIQARAQSTLDPYALQAAMQYVHQEKDRLLQEEAHAARVAELREAREFEDKLMGKLTENVIGTKRTLTVEELDQAIRGKLKPESTVDADKFFRNATKSLDPNGKGFTRAQYAKHMNLLADASPEKFKQYAKGFNASEADLKAAAEAWKGERDQFELMERLNRKDKDVAKHKPDVRQEKLSDREQLRAQIAHNMLMTSAMRDDRKAGATLKDEIPDFMFEDEFTRGDVARAMQQVEEREARGEDRYAVPDYSPEVFEVEEDAQETNDF